jgi:DNA-binding PadR family transcriptional regulator
VASPTLTTTSYAILGLLSIRPWTTYELTKQMDRSLGRVWPRAASKLYEEPKKLVSHRLARADRQQVGRRARTVYAITPKGRRALAAWLRDPGDGPVLEFEQLLKVFFSENGTKADLLATLAASEAWARSQSAISLSVGREYLEGRGPFAQRMAQLQLVSRFVTDFYALVGSWATWAAEVVGSWPDDVRDARADRAVIEETVRRAEAASAEAAPAEVVRSEGPPPNRAGVRGSRRG